MTLPGILLGTLVSAAIAVGFAFLRGSSPAHLLVYLLIGIIGFWFGHFFGQVTNIVIFKVGPVLMGDAIFTEIIFLLASVWLSYAESYSEVDSQES